MTTLNLNDWLNFSVASIEAEKTFIGLGPGTLVLVTSGSIVDEEY